MDRDDYTMPDSLLSHDPTLAAYIAVLRAALTALVDAIEWSETIAPVLGARLAYGISVALDVERAKAALRMETGRHAQEELRLLAELNAEASTIVDYVYPLLYGEPWSPSGLVASAAECREALTAFRRLIHATQDLDALGHETGGQL